MLPHIPLNVGACLFPNGDITIHGPSVQLIGLSGCTNRPFGYCGNDFSAFSLLDPSQQKELERVVRMTGQWLSTQGYLGAFGLDAMLYQGHIFVVEINPRFQGSSRQSAIIDKQLDRPDIYLCHLAAHLGINPPIIQSMSKNYLQDLNRSHIIIHNTEDRDIHPSLTSLVSRGLDRVELFPSEGVAVAPEAIVCRVVRQGSVTMDGWTLNQETKTLIENTISSYINY